MCVIFKASDVRPTAKMVELAFAKNNHGAGVAWRSEVDGKPVVRWEKGLDIEAIRGRVETLPLPFVCQGHPRKIGAYVSSLSTQQWCLTGVEGDHRGICALPQWSLE